VLGRRKAGGKGLNDILFVGFAAVSFVWDLRSRTLPNSLVALGLFGAFAAKGIGGGWAELSLAALGALAGFVCALPLRGLRAIGSADVKWFSAAGAWLGGNDVLVLLALSILCSGMAAFAWGLFSKAFRNRLKWMFMQLAGVCYSRSMTELLDICQGIAHQGKKFPFMAAVFPSVGILLVSGSGVWG
jgi:Flp pilus assembly protein protease CpaA